jgi:serine/threonine protein kinase
MLLNFKWMSMRIGTHTLTGTAGREYIYRDSRIGTGSYSVVYKGVCRQTKEPVAIKKIDLRRFKNERERINEEIEIMKKLSHIGIVQLYDVVYDNTNDYIYIVMEYCSGGDLSSVISTGLTEDMIHSYFQQLAEAFKYLHKQKILHRDIKPQNILFKDVGRKVIKITDFGFSKYYYEDTGMLETLCGSPMYMAPEILFHQKYNVKTDLWSIGIILYEMIYRKFPYQAKNTVELIKEVKRSDIKFPLVSINAECLDLMKKLLVKDPILRIDWQEFFNHSWTTVGLESNREFDVIPGSNSKLAYPMIPKSKPIPIKLPNNQESHGSGKDVILGFSNYIIDNYCLSEPKQNIPIPGMSFDANDEDELILDAKNREPVENDQVQRSNILEYMNISMELIKSLTHMSFKSI